MTAADIAKFITDNYNTFKRLDLCVSGISYKIFVKQNKVERVTLATANGKPLDDKKIYSVAMNSYMSTAYQLPVADKGEDLGKPTIEFILSYLSKRPTVAYSHQARGEIIIMQ
jgi:hypothetical protein